MNIILLGAPGSGKGTQAKALMDVEGLTHVSSGDLFRENIRGETPLGIEATGYMNRGALVPDDLTIAMIRERLVAPDVSAGVLFDGFPRTVAQAEALDRMLAAIGQTVAGAVLIDVAEDALVERLSGRRICRECQTPFHTLYKPFDRCPEDRCHGEHLYQRDDDTPETVRARLAVYRAQTEPVIDFYAAQGKLQRVAGEGPMPEVTGRMRTAVANLDGAGQLGRSAPE